MQVKTTLTIFSFILIIFFVLSDNSFAQRELKNRIPDERFKTRLPNDQTKQRERPGEKEKIKEKKLPPSIKEKKTEPKMTLRPISPPNENPISKPNNNLVERPNLNPTKYSFKKEAIDRFKEGDYSGALAYINHAIAYNPEDYELYFFRGMIELELEFFEDAKTDFNFYFEKMIERPEKYFIVDY